MPPLQALLVCYGGTLLSPQGEADGPHWLCHFPFALPTRLNASYEQQTSNFTHI
jgi:hypothetical protein